MDGSVNWTTYLFVFLCVVVPYFLADLALRLPNKKDELGIKKLPSAYRFFFPVITWAAETVGFELARYRPERTEEIRRKLLLAAMNVTPQFIYGAQFVFTVSGFLFSLPVFLLSGSPMISILISSIFALCGWFMPAFSLNSAAELRQEHIIKELPFAIDLIGTAMQAGLDFNAAVRYYAGLNFKNALTTEFSQMLKETELGVSRVDALVAMAERIQSPAFTSFVDAIALGNEIGASIISTMRMQGEDMRRARFNIAERKAARAPSLMIFPMAIFIVPAVIIVIGVPVFMRFQATGL